jgi:protein-tyrosine phosphatase
MWTRLYWADGPWPGKLALAARLRGDDWLADEIAAWRGAGVDTGLSLLTHEEELELDLEAEAREVKAKGMDFISLPVPDRDVPRSDSEVKAIVEKLDGKLSSGKNTVIHCRQGTGRSGLVAACLLIARGVSPGAAVETLSAARGATIPETMEQRSWIDHYASIFTNAK